MSNMLKNLMNYPIISSKGNVVYVWDLDELIDPDDGQNFIRMRFDERYLAFKCKENVGLWMVRKLRKSIVLNIMNDRDMRITNEDS